MIGLDTNILVRYFTQDDPIRSRRAMEILERRLSEDDPGFISIVVAVETVWVLSRSYGYADYKIAAALELLLQADNVVVEHERDVFLAVIALKEGRSSFADALISALAIRAGCTVTLTFDRKAARLPGFALP